MKKEAMFYEKLNDKIHCQLCPHNCVIGDGQFGKCSVRINENGTLFTINYGEVTSEAIDPIEKKPLSYFRQGSYIYSVGTFGCNFTCSFCQNYMISQFRPQSEYMSKEKLVKTALSIKNNIGIAFTYNEPTMWYEYIYDCAKLLKETDPSAAVVIISNGYINQEPLKKLLPYVDAMKVDLKSFSEEFYEKVCGGRLKPVLKTIETASKMTHVEVVTLLVTGENDILEEVEEIAKYLSSIDKNIPLHLTRYFPRYKLENPPTDINFMRESEKTARKYLNRVKLGNVY